MELQGACRREGVQEGVYMHVRVQEGVHEVLEMAARAHVWCGVASCSDDRIHEDSRVNGVPAQRAAADHSTRRYSMQGHVYFGGGQWAPVGALLARACASRFSLCTYQQAQAALKHRRPMTALQAPPDSPPGRYLGSAPARVQGLGGGG